MKVLCFFNKMTSVLMYTQHLLVQSYGLVTLRQHVVVVLAAAKFVLIFDMTHVSMNPSSSYLRFSITFKA